MRRASIAIILIVSSTLFAAEKDYFPGRDACFLLYNVKSGKFEKVIGEANCKKRTVPCSTFKVPLAVMAFDSGVLKDENEVLKWDGVKDEREAANKDHNAKTWMSESILWFSQRLTPMIGATRFQKYLTDFKYGNEDFSQGLTTAWVVEPEKNTGLMISPFEQVEFMKALWKDKLPVSKRAMQLTRDITFLETSPKGFRLNGKTGSYYYNGNREQRLGWFISHLQKGDKEYITATRFSDKAPIKGDYYGGLKAKEITKQILADSELW